MFTLPILAVAISEILWGLFLLLCVVAVFGAIWWGFHYIARTWELPPMAFKVGDTVLVLAGIGVLIIIILMLANGGSIQW